MATRAPPRSSALPPASRPTGRGDARAEAFVGEHRADASAQVYGIAELADEFEITHRAIRLYEQKGLLAPRRVNGQRVYSRRDRARLVLILRAKALGSTLEEIKEYLDLYGQHGEGRQKQLEYVIGKITAAVGMLEAKREQLDRSLAELRLIEQTCRHQLAERRARGRG